jgi:Na+/melibiose symporter-like transporter
MVLKARKTPVTKWVPFIISGGIILLYLIIYPTLQRRFDPPKVYTQHTFMAITGRILTTLLLTSVALFFQGLFNFVMKVKYR